MTWRDRQNHRQTDTSFYSVGYIVNLRTIVARWAKGWGLRAVPTPTFINFHPHGLSWHPVVFTQHKLSYFTLILEFQESICLLLTPAQLSLLIPIRTKQTERGRLWISIILFPWFSPGQSISYPVTDKCSLFGINNNINALIIATTKFYAI